MTRAGAMRSVPSAEAPRRAWASAPWEAARIVVAIPARDEERYLAHALDALRRAAGEVRCEVVVLANDCRDATAEVAASFGRRAAPFAVRVIERSLPPGRVGAGHARRLAMDEAASLCGPDDIVMTSDADAMVAPATLKAIAAAIAAGADLVCGGISTTLPAAVACAPSIRRIDDASAPYAALVREVRFAVDRLHGAQPEGACPHYVESGACLALTRGLYRALGGLPDRPSSEDRALVRAAEGAGARIAYDAAAHAWVSPRLDGRAVDGMAHAIRSRLADPDPQADQALVAASDLEAYWIEAVGARRLGRRSPPPPEAAPPLRASDLARELPRLRALVTEIVRPAPAIEAGDAAAGRRVA